MSKALKPSAHSNDIRILLVDDHQLFLAGLRSLIQNEPGLTVVGQAKNRVEAFEAARLNPDIIVLDLFLENENSLEFLVELIQAAHGARVLVVTGVPDRELHLRAVRFGAMGVMLKGEPPHLLFKAIRKVHQGEIWLNRTMIADAIDGILGATGNTADAEAPKIASLTSRELQVIAWLSEGLKNKQIADRLFISEKTVGHHLTSIFAKLEVADRLELLIYAYRHHLARVPPHGVSRPVNM
jgi:two-component system nitrate/nitrite response regulator NarL